MPQLARLAEQMDVAYESWLDTRRISDPDELAARVLSEGVSVLVIEADFVFEEMLEGCASLKLVGICRASTSHVDVEAATVRGVAVVNTPGRNARAVAEHALGLMFSLARRIPRANEYVRSGRWGHPAGGYVDLRGVELGGRTIGIVGMGASGGALARMCAALGMNVLAYDPLLTTHPAGATLAGLDDVASESDFISIHAPSTSDTAGMLDAEFFSRMKRSAFLVSCSDAEIADQSALVDALASGRIAGAAFDMFETQPIAPHNPLLTLDNVILTPHVGGATEETIRRHSEMMAEDVLRFARGRRPVNLVNPEVWGGQGE